MICSSSFSNEQHEMRKQIFNYLIFRVIGVICGNKHPASRKQFAAKAAPTHTCKFLCVLCASARKQVVNPSTVRSSLNDYICINRLLKPAAIHNRCYPVMQAGTAKIIC